MNWLNRSALTVITAGLLGLMGCHIDEVNGKGEEPADCTPETPNSPGESVCVPFCDALIACNSVTTDNLGQCVQSCLTQWSSNPSLTADGCTCVENSTCRDPTTYDCLGAPIPNGLGPDAGQWANCVVDQTTLADGSCQEYIQCPGPSGWSDYTIDCTSQGSSNGAAAGTAGSTFGTVGGTTGSAGGAVGGTAGGTTGSTTGGTTGSTGGTTGSTGGTTGSTGNTCTRNQDCAYDQDCINGTCLVRCSASCECPTGDACNGDGYCQSQVPPPQACDADCDCNSGQSCVNHLCQ